MFEFRFRVLDVGGGSFLGIVEGFPEILVHAASVKQAEADLVNALCEHLKAIQDLESTRSDLDDFPTERQTRLFLSPGVL